MCYCKYGCKALVYRYRHAIVVGPLTGVGGGGGSRFYMSFLRNGNVALSNIRNTPVILSIFGNGPVTCHYIFNVHVACH